MANKTKSKIVEAVGASSGTLSPDKTLSKKIEEAMTESITKSYVDGITDPIKIKANMMAAREKCLSQQK